MKKKNPDSAAQSLLASIRATGADLHTDDARIWIEPKGMTAELSAAIDACHEELVALLRSEPPAPAAEPDLAPDGCVGCNEESRGAD